MARKTKPRLGKGLSGLIGEPVVVNIPQTSTEPPSTTSPDAPAAADRGPLQMIPLDQIVPNKYQPRRGLDLDGINDLARSIRTAGVMQPIAVRPAAHGFELVAGERRWRAAAIAGLTEIPALIADLPDQEAAAWAVVENVQRQDLNPVDRALAYRQLADHFALTHTEIADRAGVDRSSVANFIRITELEPELLQLLEKGELTVGHAKVLLGLPPGELRVAFGIGVARTGMSVRELERRAAADARRASKHAAPGPAAAPPDRQMRPYAELERQLGEHLGTRVRIRHQRTGRGRIMIEYYDLEHFDGLMQALRFSYES